MFHMNCSKILPLTSIQNFSLFRMSLKTFCNVCFFYGFDLFFDSVLHSIHEYLQPSFCTDVSPETEVK